ncbi:AAA domain-containing protein [Paenibacillus sophorae]|nr:AAA family ATPase [Paenibacillus sophorae]SEO95801.1 AAA domain-containing protein [Paenibacillus sophorae]
MRIQRLEIGGFGRLHGRELELSAGLTVLYGPNEAGKSTMLQFIRAMLFGIPGRNYPAERLEPVHGGLHGGVLTARDGQGKAWSIRRYAGGSEGGKGDRLKITLSSMDGSVEELGQEELEKHLLGGVSRTMFRQLFAVTLDELQELGTLQSEEMSSYLFHAGIGGGGEILRAERRLQQEAEKLYKPRGRTQEAAKTLQSIEKLERQIAESRSYLPRYNDNTAALQAAESELEELERRRREEGAWLTRLRKALDIRDLWLKWEAARQELGELPDFPSFPEDAPERWRDLQSRTGNAAQAAARAERIVAELKEELAVTAHDPRLEAQGPRLERLLRAQGGYENRKTELRRLDEEWKLLREHLQRILRSIHPGWTAGELTDFAGAAADREAARRFGVQFAAYDRRMEGLAAERQALRVRLAAAQASLQQAERSLAREQREGAASFAALRPISPRETARLWDELQQAAERWREAQLRQALPGAAAAAGGRRTAAAAPLLPLAAALTALLPAALWLTGAPPVSAWIVLGVLAAADLALLAGGRGARRQTSPPPVSGGEEAAAEMLRLRGLLLSAPEAESGDARPERRSRIAPASPDAGGLEAGMKELRRLMDAWTDWHQRAERLSGERDLRRTEADALAGQEQALVREMDAAEEEFRGTSARFEEWLRRRNLPEDLSPEGLPDIFRLAEQGNELLRREDGLHLRIAELKRETSAFEEECLLLMAEAGETAEETASASEEAARKACEDVSRASSFILSDAASSAASLSGIREPDLSPSVPTRASQTDSAPPDSRPRVVLLSGELPTAAERPGNSSDPPTLLSPIRWLEERAAAWEILKLALLRRKDLMSRMRGAEEELEENRRELEAVRQISGDLLREGGAEDGEDLLRRAAALSRRRELERSLRHWELAMFGGRDEEERQGLLELLALKDAYALEEERKREETGLAELEERRNALLQLRGRLLQERESLKKVCREDTTLQQLEEQKAALRGIAEQYAVSALAAELISRTRRIYEREKQPQVLALASSYFERLTGGEYRRVVMTLGKKELKAEHREAGLLDSGLLSRGTAEQLYLALRLALAGTMDKQDPLPLLFDDLFVNFDERRLQAALSLLGELSASRQVVMLTCHRHVAEAAARLVTDASVISV